MANNVCVFWEVPANLSVSKKEDEEEERKNKGAFGKKEMSKKERKRKPVSFFSLCAFLIRTRWRVWDRRDREV